MYILIFIYWKKSDVINILIFSGGTAPLKGALKCSFFAVAALVGAGLLSCCLLRQPASFTAQPTNEQFQDPFRIKIKTIRLIWSYQKITKVQKNRFEGKILIF